jgi:xylulokinase
VAVGVDVGITSVKALAVDSDGWVVTRPRSPTASSPTSRRYWSATPDGLGARASFQGSDLRAGAPVARVAVAAVVPSLTAANGRGVPLLSGLLYGDARGRREWNGPLSDRSRGRATTYNGREGGVSSLPDASGFLRWAVGTAPEAAGYWPCQGRGHPRPRRDGDHGHRHRLRRPPRLREVARGGPAIHALALVESGHPPMAE